MKISTKGRYGLRILIDIAANRTSKPRMIKQIAQNQGISQKYVSRLVLDLRNAGFIKSIRGVNGGYVLAKPANSISILEVVEAMEGEIAIVDCLAKADCCNNCLECPSRHIWKSANDALKNSLGWLTLASAISGYENKI
ncbi:MAG: Rrf2 family transcriptional regulator [Verrucomicrobiaceae bacterium]|nr:Rrf2 family transcriptional regulator [Verrucomicrobiaceae bacterium]